MKIFNVSATYDEEYDYYRSLEITVIANDKEEARKKFIENCENNIEEVRRFLRSHPKLINKLVIEIDPGYASFHDYYDLTYVNNEHNATYEDYLGYGKESSWFTPPTKTEKNYKKYLEYKQFWNNAYENYEKYKNDEEKQKEYREYVKKCEDEAKEENKKLLSDEFILDFFKKLEIYEYEIKINEFENKRLDK